MRRNVLGASNARAVLLMTGSTSELVLIISTLRDKWKHTVPNTGGRRECQAILEILCEHLDLQPIWALLRANSQRVVWLLYGVNQTTKWSEIRQRQVEVHNYGSREQPIQQGLPENSTNSGMKQGFRNDYG